MKTELTFNLEDIAGEIKIVYNIFNFKVYHNGIGLKRRGKFKPTYTLQTTNGTDEQIKILNNAFKGYMVEYRGERIRLEKGLTPVESAMAFIPLVIFCIGCFKYFAIGGVIGGALIGFCVGLSMVLGCNLIRQIKGIGLQLLIMVTLGICTFIIYILAGYLLASVLTGMTYRLMY